MGGTRPERFRRTRDACIGFTVTLFVCICSLSVVGLVRHSPMILVSTTHDYQAGAPLRFAVDSEEGGGYCGGRDPGQAMQCLTPNVFDPQYTMPLTTLGSSLGHYCPLLLFNLTILGPKPRRANPDSRKWTFRSEAIAATVADIYLSIPIRPLAYGMPTIVL